MNILVSSPITSWQIVGETMEVLTDFIFLGFRITADGDYSHEIKICLLLGRKPMTNLYRILKSRDITWPTKVCLIKAMVFPAVMYGCESWTIKKAKHWRTGAFELWCWRKLWESLGLPGDKNGQSSRKLVLNIHWKDWCWNWSSNTLATWSKESTHWKRSWCWERKIEGKRRRGWQRTRWLDGITDSMDLIWANPKR